MKPPSSPNGRAHNSQGSTARAGAVPQLPAYARLPADSLVEAKRSGQWLDRYIEVASLASPMTPYEFHEALGLSLISTAIARRLALPAGATKIYTNLYILIVAPSTLYHKSTAFDFLRVIMREAGMEALLLVPTQTPESLLSDLTTRTPGTFGTWTEYEQKAWKAERAFTAQRAWYIEEASRLIESFNRDYTAGLLPLLLRLYDCPDEEIFQTISRGRQVLRDIYVTLVGATTPAALKQHLDNREYWGNGLWARIVMVSPDHEPPEWNFWNSQITIPPEVVRPLKKLAFERLKVPELRKMENSLEQDQPEVVPVNLEPGVWEMWEAYSKALGHDLLKEGKVDEHLFASYGRLATTAIKVAQLLAAIDWAEKEEEVEPTINFGHWARAQRICESWRLSLHRLVDNIRKDNRETKVEKVLRIAVNGPSKGRTMRELRQYTHIGRDELESIVEDLLSEGVLEPNNPPGVNAVYYRPAATHE